ncbi:MAG TPA: hypothetical protein VI895_08135 [Bdellovibrionota bacterium]|nr:hypothetical protein [Bdellovibrionota bacterium]
MVYLRFAFTLLVAGLFQVGLAEDKQPKEKPVTALIQEAERWLYANEVPDHLDRVEETLDQIAKRDPNLPYAHWARARVMFWRKEAFYLLEKKDTRDKFEKEKLALADQCHTHCDKCLELAPQNAECHLMKGVCYAMQVSTWGGRWKSVRAARQMDEEWKRTISLPSDFKHRGVVTTAQLAMVLRGILYRLMPDSWWFGFIAGIQGDKEKAYEWMNEGVVDFLMKEPVTLLEKAATAICYGQAAKKPEKIEEGLALLRTGLKLPSRYALDDLDKRNMKILLEIPRKGCSYRRERFEEISEQRLKDEVQSSSK